MGWEVIALISLVCDAAYSVQNRIVAKNNPHDALLTTVLIHLLLVYPTGVAWAKWQGGIDLNLSLQTWTVVFIVASIFAVAKVFAFKAVTRIDAAQFALLSNARTVVTIIVSSIFLGHVLTLQQSFAALLLLSAAAMAVSYRFNKETVRIGKFTVIALLSSMLSGIGTSGESYLLEQMNGSTYFVVGWGTQVLVMCCLSTEKLAKSKEVINPTWLKSVLTLGLLKSCQGICFVYALEKSGNSSLFATIFSFSTILVVAASYFLLNEKEAPAAKISATIMGFLGLFVLRRSR